MMASQTADAPLLNHRYTLLETIGAGGMAVVYKAQDTMLERPVAIKLLRQDYSNNEEFKKQFRLEAKSAANLSHPNIITVHDFGYDAGRLFIVMEYLPGKDLKYLIRQNGRFNVSEAVHLILQACAGIGYAHRAGIVHCDVKPHNMLVAPDMRLKMTDFGIARALSTINPDEKSEEVWGSPQYFSPEQAKGLAPSPASDVYSLGVVLYEMLTGQLPFTHTDPQELARMHREARPVAPRRFNHDIPPALEQIILKVLSKEPAQRYRSADQLGRVLAPFSSYTEIYAIPAIQTANNPPPPARPGASNTYSNSTTRAPSQQQYRPPEQPVQSYQAQPVQPQSSTLSMLLTPGIISLGLTALLLLVGLIPFWTFILSKFGLLN
jgi:serine/threonine protein kinase